MTRFLVLVSFLVVCLFANFSGLALAGVANDGLSLKNFKLADSKPYDALAKAFQKTRHQAVSSNSTKSSHKKVTSKLTKKSKIHKKSKAYKSKSSRSHRKSFAKKSKSYKKAAYRH
ncbi:MAG: hypothetical protein M1511_05830 [Deltaproteobacteria bacterium]|nr:hypothetical protein [Deltaproteobacteria bacterium]